jgi:hypothetical protein
MHWRTIAEEDRNFNCLGPNRTLISSLRWRTWSNHAHFLVELNKSVVFVANYGNAKEVLGLGLEPKDLGMVQVCLRGVVVFIAGLAMLRVGHKRFMARQDQHHSGGRTVNCNR